MYELRNQIFWSHENTYEQTGKSKVIYEDLKGKKVLVTGSSIKN